MIAISDVPVAARAPSASHTISRGATQVPIADADACSHAADLLRPGQTRTALGPAFATWRDRVRDFALGKDSPELRMMRVRIEDKGAIVAFHWRGARDEATALTRIEAIAAEA